MIDPHLNRQDAEHIIAGGPLPGRADLLCMLELAAFMRASSEVEPAPPMRADLIWQIDSRAGP
jgi:hypothetical protein